MGSKSNSKTTKGGKQNGSKSNGNKSQSQDTRTGKEQNGDSQTDYSMLRKPIDISVNGISQVVKIYQTATAEVRQLLAYECDLVYECKVCRNLFRSLANFLSHKRVYCKDQFTDTKHAYPANHLVEDRTTVIQPEPVPPGPCKETWITSDATYDPTTIMGSLSGDSSGVLARIETSVPRINKHSKPKRDLSQVIEKLTQKRGVKKITETVGHISASKFYETISEKIAAQRDATKEHIIRLESIENTKFGVFQTVLQSSSTVQMDNTDLMKAQVVELHNMMTCNEATLGPDGQITMLNGEGGTHFAVTSSGEERNTSQSTNIRKQDSPYSSPSKQSPKENHVCNICNTRFSTRKTLNHHMKSLHVTFRTCYPCPCCKNTFCNTWSVYRHLYKVHRKTTLQVRKLRSQIVNKAFRKEVPVCESKSPSAKPSSVVPQTEADKARKEQQRLHQENQAWMNNFEDDLELQMCGGCGRRFERRAALNSHSQICQKRLAVQNNIKIRQTSPTLTTTTVGSRVTGTKISPTSIQQQQYPSTSTERQQYARIETFRNETTTETSLVRLTPLSLSSENMLSSSPIPLDIANSSMLASTSGISYHRTRHCSGSRDNTKKDVPEKRIEIQIRRDYCKPSSGTGNSLVPVGGSPCQQQDCGSEINEKSLSCSNRAEGYNENGLNNYEDCDGSNKLCKSRDSDMGVSKKDVDMLMNKEDESTVTDISSLEKETVEERNVKVEGESMTDGENANPIEVPRTSNNVSKSSETNLNFTDDNLTDRQMAVVIRASNRKTRQESTNSASVSESSDLNNETMDDEKDLTDVSRAKKKKELFSPIMESRMQTMINIRRLQCLPCQKKFNKLTNLRRHVAVHIGWNRYRCIECNFKCFSKYDCVAHVNKMHLGNKEREKAQTMVEYIEVTDLTRNEQSAENVVQSGDSNDNIDSKMNYLELRDCDGNKMELESDNCVAFAYDTDIFQIKEDNILPTSFKNESETEVAAKLSTDNTTKTVMDFDQNVKGTETTNRGSTSAFKIDIASEPLLSLRSGRKRRILSSDGMDFEQLETVPSKKMLMSAECKENSVAKTSKDAEESDTVKSEITISETEKNTYCVITPTTEEVDELERDNLSLPRSITTQTQLRKMVLQVIFGTNNSNASQDLESAQDMFSTIENGECSRSDGSTSPYDVVEAVSSHSTSPITTSSSTDSSALTSDDAASVITENSPGKDENKNNKQHKRVRSFTPSSETERRQRPVRNRVRVERADFIYDLSDKCLDPKKDSEEHKLFKRKQQEDRTRESVKLPEKSEYSSAKSISKAVVKPSSGENSGVKSNKTGNSNKVLQVSDISSGRNSQPVTKVAVKPNLGENSGVKTNKTGNSNVASQVSDTSSGRNSSGTVGYNISTRKSQRTFDLSPHKVPSSHKEKSD